MCSISPFCLLAPLACGPASCTRRGPPGGKCCPDLWLPVLACLLSSSINSCCKICCCQGMSRRKAACARSGWYITTAWVCSSNQERTCSNKQQQGIACQRWYCNAYYLTDLTALTAQLPNLRHTWSHQAALCSYNAFVRRNNAFVRHKEQAASASWRCKQHTCCCAHLWCSHECISATEYNQCV